MERHEFDSYAEYVDTQVGLTRSKVKKEFGLSSSPEILNAVVQHQCVELGFPLRRGCCHGVRQGQELDFFESAAPDCHWVGTEITPELCDEERVFELDFCKRQPHWEGVFDLVYSNSLDHANDPPKAVANWLSTLSDRGRLYIEWSAFHQKLSRASRTKADCFAASIEEYQTMLNRIASVESSFQVKHPRRGHFHTVFVVTAR